jgi:enoyl-CoA hydratase/carnithine racemase
MPHVHLDVTDDVALLTLDDVAKKNAMSPELGAALRNTVKTLQHTPTVRAAVLTGAGDAFSAGGNLAMLEQLRSVSAAEAKAFMLDFYHRYLSILDLPMPLIAAVRGPAIGAGLAVALACDIVIVAEDAKLAINFAKLGLYPGMGSTYFLRERAGAGRARELLATGRRFSGRDAVAYGLAEEAVADGDVLPRAKAVAREIAASAPLVTGALKARLGWDRAALDRALEHEAEEQAKSYATFDLGEGLSALEEKRPAVFEGR